MCTADESSTERQKKAYVAHTWATLFFSVVAFLASVVYCLKYISIDFEGAMFAFMVAVGEFGMIYFMVVAIRMRHQIDNIFASLSAIYKSSEFILLKPFVDCKIFFEHQFLSIDS